ncbi:MAG: hypothetical protein ACYC3W_02440 [Candidatus Nanopelagicales bacterium]
MEKNRMHITQDILLVTPNQPANPLVLRMAEDNGGFVLLESGLREIPARAVVEYDEDSVRCINEHGDDLWSVAAVEMVGVGVDRADLLEAAQSAFSGRVLH